MGFLYLAEDQSERVVEAVYIYGAGNYGIAVLDFLIQADIKVEGFLDNYKSGEISAIPVIKPSDVKNPGQVIVLDSVTACPFEQIKEQLSQLGFCNIVPCGDFVKKLFPDVDITGAFCLKQEEQELVNSAASLFCSEYDRKQYLHAAEWLMDRSDKNLLDEFESGTFNRDKYFPDFLTQKIRPTDAMLDACLLDGEFIEKFRAYSQGTIYAFTFFPEAERKMIFPNSVKVFEMELGVNSSKNQELFCGIMRPYTNTKCSFCHHVISLDMASKEYDIQFQYLRLYSMRQVLPILRNGIQIIEQCRPMISVNLAHYKDDFLEVPHFIYDTLQNYTMHFRVHSFLGNDYILYAIPDERELLK